ncbi:hypothetical protein PG994_007641 [Apiospora phragmitis]|uniref:Uncharacterized protein n=1 Tax=Apiospora phragmitis TaxID=2905665 RepID=A0ABR1UQS6_9PEZI
MSGGMLNVSTGSSRDRVVDWPAWYNADDPATLSFRQESFCFLNMGRHSGLRKNKNGCGGK